jgi:hypothetical protein
MLPTVLAEYAARSDLMTIGVAGGLIALFRWWIRVHYRSRDRERLEHTATALADRGVKDVVILHGPHGDDEVRFSTSLATSHEAPPEDVVEDNTDAVQLDVWRTAKDPRLGQQ